MTAAQAIRLYPHNALHREANADLRKTERRNNTMDTPTNSLPEQRTKFEAAVLADEKARYGYVQLAGTTLRGSFTDDGDWVYYYAHIQERWKGWQSCLSSMGVVLK